MVVALAEIVVSRMISKFFNGLHFGGNIEQIVGLFLPLDETLRLSLVKFQLVGKVALGCFRSLLRRLLTVKF
jgi:hypothetical protein